MNATDPAYAWSMLVISLLMIVFGAWCIRKAWRYRFPPPKPEDFPDLTNRTLGFDGVVKLFFPHTNRKVPSVGDVLSVLETDGSGMTIRSQSNHRIAHVLRKARVVITESGNMHSIESLRPYRPRMWIIGF